MASNWKTQFAGGEAFQPFADMLGIPVEDILAAVRDEGSQVTVLYSTMVDEEERGYRAIFEMDEETPSLALLTVAESPQVLHLMEQIGTDLEDHGRPRAD